MGSFNQLVSRRIKHSIIDKKNIQISATRHLVDEIKIILLDYLKDLKLANSSFIYNKPEYSKYKESQSNKLEKIDKICTAINELSGNPQFKIAPQIFLSVSGIDKIKGFEADFDSIKLITDNIEFNLLIAKELEDCLLDVRLNLGHKYAADKMYTKLGQLLTQSQKPEYKLKV